MKTIMKILRALFKLSVWVIAFAVIAVLLLMSYCSFEMRESKLFDGVKFDKETWRNRAGITIDLSGSKSSSKAFPSVYGTDIRCKMYHDIVTNYLKKDMDLNKVKELLGDEGFVTYCTDEKTKCITYGFGICYASALTIYHNSLNICFDKNQRIVGFGLKDYLDKTCKKKFSCMHKKKCKCTETTEMEHGGVSMHSIECPFKIDKW